ncbi:MAG TPA: biotin--[acetyl-CoA-carboxylase] ligase [Arenibacter sp.]|nr:biotin--[acetyl-CoA-carboxylase] ligase [Arenibacter sp.]
MHLIKLNATDSTNAYLKDMLLGRALEDFTVVAAGTQLKGRGQMGTSWISEPGKNLTFSVLKNFKGLGAIDQFRINICVSISIYEALSQINIPDLMIKWPNDIMSGRHKICGILIENMLSGQDINASIIGVGLNVNQLAFENLPDVSSLKLLTGINFDLDEVLFLIVGRLKINLGAITGNHFEALKLSYGNQLFRKDRPSTFRNGKGELFMGFIKGVSDSGKLLVLLEDDVLQEFDLKQLRLLY